jgi:LemA protein
VEAYPDLKANQNFLQLQEELSDIENNLLLQEDSLTALTTEYNNAVETFSINLIANNLVSNVRLCLILVQKEEQEWKNHQQLNFRLQDLRFQHFNEIYRTSSADTKK